MEALHRIRPGTLRAQRALPLTHRPYRSVSGRRPCRKVLRKIDTPIDGLVQNCTFIERFFTPNTPNRPESEPKKKKIVKLKHDSTVSLPYHISPEIKQNLLRLTVPVSARDRCAAYCGRPCSKGPSAHRKEVASVTVMGRRLGQLHHYENHSIRATQRVTNR